MKKIIRFSFFLLLLLVVSCNNTQKGKTKLRTDTLTSGEAIIAADESFAPVIQEELDVFEALNPEAVIKPIYSSEKEIMNLLLKDSIRLVLAARDLTEREKSILKEKKLQPRSQKIAVDGVAIIINKENKDSLISTHSLKKIMSGQITAWNELNPSSNLKDITVVFDNPQSSTARFIRDSINKGENLAERLRAETSNEAVIEYVKKHPSAMGIIGVNWISSPTDTLGLNFLKQIRVMSVSKSETATLENSYKPHPAYLALKYYPLCRDVYVILSDLRGTLPAGFVNFIAGDNGQRIILKAGLLPATRPTRIISMKESFNELSK